MRQYPYKMKYYHENDVENINEENSYIFQKIFEKNYENFRGYLEGGVSRCKRTDDQNIYENPT